MGRSSRPPRRSNGPPGRQIGKRQVEDLTRAAAVDVEAFYAAHRPAPAAAADILVLSADGKGVVMRPDALRAVTARSARSRKLSTRLSKGEKRDRKRMAEVAAVYDLAAHPRSPGDIITIGVPAEADDSGHSGHRTGRGDGGGEGDQPAPRAAGKWLTASLTHTTGQVIAAAFDEAERRDPGHARTWVGLVDGNNHQIDRINAEAARRAVTVHIVVRLHPRAGVLVEGRLVLPPRRRHRPPRPGSPTTPCGSCTATRPWSRPRSAARPPPVA